MIHRLRSRTQRGFTLVELAIVLAVTGVLFLGLYRLLSGGNQQIKDSAVASQQIQLINAAKQFLGSSNGAQWMGSEGGSITAGLPIPPLASAPNGTDNSLCYTYMRNAARDPSFATDPAHLGNLYKFCDALPAGFSTLTFNAYGQTYAINVDTGPIVAPATVPSTYTFMIVTSGGDLIPDADGGRISSEIGTDGGFIYANTAVCASGSACGAYGAWTVALSTFGFGSATSGHIATRTYYSPEMGSTLPWLARQLMPTDTAATTTSSPNYNTMTTDLFLGGKSLWLAANTNATSPYNPLIPTGAINVQGGAINLQAGGIADTISNGDSLTLSPATSYLSSTATRANPFLGLATGCTVDQTTSGVTGLHWNGSDSASKNGSNTSGNDCQSAIQVSGDVNIWGELQAVTLFAQTFVYNSSDMRLKTNITPMSHPLDDIMRMKPVTFDFKANGQKGIGFIAQDIEKIYPQLVMEKKSDGMKAVNYEGLIAPLVGAVQELKRENDDLRAQLRDEKLREDRLEKSLSGKAD